MRRNQSSRMKIPLDSRFDQNAETTTTHLKDSERCQGLVIIRTYLLLESNQSTRRCKARRCLDSQGMNDSGSISSHHLHLVITILNNPLTKTSTPPTSTWAQLSSALRRKTLYKAYGSSKLKSNSLDQELMWHFPNLPALNEHHRI